MLYNKSQIKNSFISLYIESVKMEEIKLNTIEFVLILLIAYNDTPSFIVLCCKLVS